VEKNKSKDESNTKKGARTKRGVSKRSRERDSIVGKITKRDPLDHLSAPNIVVPPDMQKADEYIIRPSYLVKQNTLSAKASQAFETVKGKSEETVEAIKRATGTGVKTTDSDITGKPLVLPVLEQKFSTDKKTILETASVEKRWIEGKKFVEVPIKYEQIFVNNEELGKSSLVSELGEAASQIKDAILKIIPIDLSNKDKDIPPDSNWVPLLGPDTDVERTFPIYAEQLVISKKIVKVGDVIIRKRQVTKQEMLDVDLVHEDVTIENPPPVSEKGINYC
jgi:stress response protein YsnF